jgi:hypothetical protein
MSKVRIKVSSEKEASALLADKDKLAGGIAPLHRSLEVTTSPTRFTR